MSDIQGDSFASAHEIETPYQNTAYINYAKDYDFYKFVPTVSGTYKMYTEGSLDTYGHLYNSSQSQLTYNDDAGDGTNFLISYSLTAGQTYYLKARAYSTTRTGAYTIHIINAESNSTASYTSGVIYPISISAQNIEDVSDKTFCIEYDSSKFEVYDLCAFTEYQDKDEGYISGTGIKILKTSNGEIRFSVDNEFEVSSFSGIVNIIRLKAKTTGSHNINVRVQ